MQAFNHSMCEPAKLFTDLAKVTLKNYSFTEIIPSYIRVSRKLISLLSKNK
jgi:hypothetical protein